MIQFHLEYSTDLVNYTVYFSGVVVDDIKGIIRADASCVVVAEGSPEILSVCDTKTPTEFRFDVEEHELSGKLLGKGFTEIPGLPTHEFGVDLVLDFLDEIQHHDQRHPAS